MDCAIELLQHTAVCNIDHILIFKIALYEVLYHFHLCLWHYILFLIHAFCVFGNGALGSIVICDLCFGDMSCIFWNHTFICVDFLDVLLDLKALFCLDCN